MLHRLDEPVRAEAAAEGQGLLETRRDGRGEEQARARGGRGRDQERHPPEGRGRGGARRRGGGRRGGGARGARAERLGHPRRRAAEVLGGQDAAGPPDVLRDLRGPLRPVEPPRGPLSTDGVEGVREGRARAAPLPDSRGAPVPGLFIVALLLLRRRRRRRGRRLPPLLLFSLAFGSRTRNASRSSGDRRSLSRVRGPETADT